MQTEFVRRISLLDNNGGNCDNPGDRCHPEMLNGFRIWTCWRITRLGNVYTTVWERYACGGTRQVSFTLTRLLEVFSRKVYVHTLDSEKGSVPKGVSDGKH